MTNDTSISTIYSNSPFPLDKSSVSDLSNTPPSLVQVFFVVSSFLFLHCADAGTDEIVCPESESVSFASFLEELGISDTDGNSLLSNLGISTDISDICALFQSGDLNIDTLLEQAQELNLSLSYFDLIEQEVLTARQLITLDPLLKNLIGPDLMLTDLLSQGHADFLDFLVEQPIFDNNIDNNITIATVYVDLPFPLHGYIAPFVIGDTLPSFTSFFSQDLSLVDLFAAFFGEEKTIEEIRNLRTAPETNTDLQKITEEISIPLFSLIGNDVRLSVLLDDSATLKSILNTTESTISARLNSILSDILIADLVTLDASLLASFIDNL